MFFITVTSWTIGSWRWKMKVRLQSFFWLLYKNTIELADMWKTSTPNTVIIQCWRKSYLFQAREWSTMMKKLNYAGILQGQKTKWSVETIFWGWFWRESSLGWNVEQNTLHYWFLLSSRSRVFLVWVLGLGWVFFQINLAISAELLMLSSLFPPYKNVQVYLKFWIVIQVK